MPQISPPYGTQGMLFIGTSLAGVLFGVSCLQIFFYYSNYPKDPWHLKLLVAVVFTCDFLHQLMCTHAVYDYLIIRYGENSDLTPIPWSLATQILVAAIITILVQSFYAYRVYHLSSKNWCLTFLVSFSILPAFGLGIVCTVKYRQMKGILNVVEIAPIILAGNILNVYCDLAIMAVMVWLLQKSRTGLRSSDIIINVLLVLIVNTGLLTSVCAALALFWLFASPHGHVYAIFFAMNPRFYANSLFAALNARASIRQQLQMRTESFSFNFVAASNTDRTTGSSVTGQLPEASTIQLVGSGSDNVGDDSKVPSDTGQQARA